RPGVDHRLGFVSVQPAVDQRALHDVLRVPHEGVEISLLGSALSDDATSGFDGAEGCHEAASVVQVQVEDGGDALLGLIPYGNALEVHFVAQGDTEVAQASIEDELLNRSSGAHGNARHVA